MDFEAIIRAVFKPGNVESQIKELIKDRKVTITPTIDSTKQGLNSSDKKAIDSRINSQASYSQKAYSKIKSKYYTGDYYSSGDTKVNKERVSAKIKEANEIKEIEKEVAQSTQVSRRQASSAVKRSITEETRELKQQYSEQEKAIKRANTISENIRNNTYTKDLTKSKSSFNSYINDGSSAYKKASSSLKEYIKSSQELSNINKNFTVTPNIENANKLISTYEKLSKSSKELKNNLSILNVEQGKAISDGSNIQKSNQIKNYLDNNTKASKKYGTQLKNLAKEAEDATTQTQLTDIDKKFKNLKSEISVKGLTGNSIFSEIKRGVSQISEFVGVYGILQAAMNKAGEMVQNTYDVNDAMIDLRMATGINNDEANKMMKTYSKMGNQLKATATDVATASTEWMKQGETTEQANQLSKYSIMLSKIGDLSSEDATKYLTSARKGYQITSLSDTSKIIDKISAVDIASATDVGGLAEGMSEVATNANLAGISMDKLLSYLAVIGETTQEGMSSVGVGLNAIFSRMGNIKLARLKDYQNNGEDLKTWGMVA